MSESMIGFLSGVGVSLVGALVVSLLTRVQDRRKYIDERRFEIYMKLIELHGYYFWYTVAEVHGEKVHSEVIEASRRLAWQIADLLRSADEVEYLEDILEVVLGSKYQTARERYSAMGDVIKHLGKRVNPRYTKKIHEISEENMHLLASGGKSNSPGANLHLPI